ncbi:MAG: M15 family metallopeptidase [Treponema sp.]|nr:M15 family metallopeptidase [Treponema sp.]
MKIKCLLLIFIVNSLCFSLFGQTFIGIGNLKYFERAYPDITFERRYDLKAQDWVINVTVPSVPGDKNSPGKTTEFYWANASFLPAEELPNKDKYWPLLYTYLEELADPADFTEEQKEQIKKFSSDENRKNGAGTPMFLFDAIYDSNTRRSLETHIKRIKFLGKMTNVHDRMVEPLGRVEKRINNLAKADSSVQEFLNNLSSTDAYSWRIIDGTKRKSFHSYGIAIDILPRSQGGKQIFWSWAADKYPDTWMLVPLKNRWMPPDSVIKVFEEEGFIWGGKWVIYDNMHFEYHPELIQYNFYRKM